MPYIGNQGSVAGFVNQPSKQDLTGATGGTLTLTHAVSGPEDISLFINNVRQEPGTSYQAVGTTVTLQGYTVAASDDIYVLYNGLTQLSSVPVDGSVSTAKIADSAITNAKINTMAASKLTGALPAIDGSALTGLSATSVAVIADQKAASTVGGTATSGSWQTRTLNTELHDPDSIVSISGSQFLLGAGDYLIQWAAPAFKVNTHQTRLYNATSASVVALGKSAYGADGRDIQQDSTGSAYVSLTANANFQIQHRVQTTKATNGYGNAVSWGNNIYTLVTIFKVG